MKKTLTAYLVAEQYDWDESPSFCLWPFPPTQTTDRAVLGTVTVEVDIPDDFDIRPSKIAALEGQIERETAAFTAKVTGMRRKIAELKALEYTEVAA